MKFTIQISTKSKTGQINRSFARCVDASDYAAACEWIFKRYHNQVVIHGEVNDDRAAALNSRYDQR